MQGSSPRWGAITLTFAVSAPIKHVPVVSYRLTPHFRGQRLHSRKCAYARDRFLDSLTELRREYRGMYSSRRNAEGIPKKRLGITEGPREMRVTFGPQRDDLASVFMVRERVPFPRNSSFCPRRRQSRRCILFEAEKWRTCTLIRLSAYRLIGLSQ